jgi:methylated-DNA-[protein]-cysteine S-methyltransferase
MTYAYKTVLLPVGELKLVASEAGLAAVLWPGDDPKRVRLPALAPSTAHPVLLDTERQLRDYFIGRRRTFTVPLDMAGTPFQQAVWQALLTIPYGETRSYSELAKQVGRPAASRAVGAANGRNPVSIIVPCHRAIGADGSLTGFAGGLDVKRYLLDLEGARLPAAA